MKINGIVRVIGRKECLRCGYPVQVEAYTVDQAKNMLEGYEACHHNIIHDNMDSFCNNKTWSFDSFNIIVQKK